MKCPPLIAERIACVALVCIALGGGVPTHALAFDLQGHRGARGLAPENTLAAFRRALAIGVTTLETDLAVTSDDQLVLSHDPMLNPALVREDGRWITPPGPAIRSLTLADLRRFDVGRLNPESPYARTFGTQQAVDGERFPTLAELLALVRASGKPTRLNLETKITPTSGAQTPEPARFAAMAVAAVREAGFADRVTIQSFDWRTLVEIRRIAPEIETACLTISTSNFDSVAPGPDGASPWHAGLRSADFGASVPRLAKAAGCATWSMFWRNLTPALVAEAKGLGLKVLPWTVNEVADMAQLIDWGVDGIITDYPDRLRGVMAGRGMKLP